VTDVDRLEEELSRPDSAVTVDLARVPGAILVLGAGGKMGPSLARMAARARAGSDSVYAASRFSDPAVSARLSAAGIRTIVTDLLEPGALAVLPDAPNVVYMAGRKFGSTGAPEETWASNAFLPGLVMERFRSSRIVVFSTGNVYPFTPVPDGGPSEEDPVGPVGEYAQSALARERVVTYGSRRHGTPAAILRLNYAIEPRYGILRDLADRIWRGQPIDLTTGHANVIWQRDAVSIALRALAHCHSPPLVLNVTGTEVVSIRSLAQAIGAALGKAPVFVGRESATALLSNAARAATLFGPPPTSLATMVDRVSIWVRGGGGGLGKPTHYDERTGAF